MTMFTVDFIDDIAIEWHQGGRPEPNRDWAPTCYIGPGTHHDLDPAKAWLQDHKHVKTIQRQQKHLQWRDDRSTVLAVETDSITAIPQVPRQCRDHFGPLAYRFYNVDLSPKFRYCLETGTEPTADTSLDTLRIEIADQQIVSGDISPVTIDGTTYTGSPSTILDTIERYLNDHDPDIIQVSHSTVIERLYDAADTHGHETFTLGRMRGMEQLAGASSYEQYGKVGHSPARYNIPGRAIINEENSFFLTETNMAGLRYLVRQSHKPIQEAAWASIGNILTAIQIRTAHANDVLVPWKAWRPEMHKSMQTLHDSDRGGFIFSPDVGLHHDIHAADFSSLYPNIIRTRRVSPDVIRCDCHPDREDVPGLGYSLCPDGDAYLQDVLGQLIDDRAAFKTQLRSGGLTSTEETRIQGMADSIKWILVSCFGYQGFSNAKFGRIECHEAINAFAREILLDAKTTLEDAGYSVIHGIIDSIWVNDNNATVPIEEVCDTITDDTGIPLDYEGMFDWIVFCPNRETPGGALNRYFGKRTDGSMKMRGIEARQHSTPPFIAETQRTMLTVLDERLAPEDVLAYVKQRLRALEQGCIDPSRLTITRRITKEPAAYSQSIKAADAVRRAKRQYDHHIMPGQTVSYIVYDDDSTGQARVRLAYEQPETYDTAFYRDRLLHATESILAPFGLSRQEIDTRLAQTQTTVLPAFTTN